MTPTIVLRDGKLFLVLGVAGRVAHHQRVLEGDSVNVVDFGMNVQDAVDAPRLHHQWMPDVLYAGDTGFRRTRWRCSRRAGTRFRRSSPLAAGREWRRF